MHRLKTATHRACVALYIAALGATAHAATVTSVSPQGEVAQVRQVVVKFSEPVVPFGDLRQPDPFNLSCEGPVPKGAGRWSDDRVWLYDFQEQVPPGTRCTLKARSEWKPLKGSFASANHSFSTGGPAVSATQPYAGAQIEEDQHFLLRLTGPAVESTVLANARCEIEGIGERVPVRIITGAVRDEVLKARRLTKDAARWLLVACQRPLPADTPVRLVWGAGIAAQANPQVLTRTEQRYSFRVRKPFTAEFSCERERAEAPCLPIRPMSLRFSAPVPRATAEAVRLKPASGSAIKPQFDKDDTAAEVSEVRFPTPLPESMAMTVELPREVKDAAGRTLANAGSFPLKVATGDAPPIAKFAAAPFGVIEWGEREADAMLPVTLRHVQGDLRSGAASGAVRIKTLRSDADILAWYGKLARAHERDHESREVSLLAQAPNTQRLDLPKLQGGDPRPFEVVGIPLPEPGYHVVEIESRRLGESLLDKKAPMYVRTGVLVTNLGVHFKLGRENSLVFVTTLDRGKPVGDADVAVYDCAGRRQWAGRTDARGLARVDKALLQREVDCEGEGGYFVTARKAMDKGATDLAFVFSHWQKGVEPWRFSHPTSLDPEPDLRAHTVFDRTLLRAGETVSMKHFIRREISAGLAMLPAAELPTRMKIIHQGSGQEYVQPLSWNGARSASSTWNIPGAAKLGVYDVVLERPSAKDDGLQRRWASGSFRVEEFRLPLVDARVSGPKTVAVAPKELPVNVQLNYFSGGGMGQAPARLTALLRERSAGMPGYDEFNFGPPRETNRDDDEPRSEQGKLVADKLPLTTDRNGAATVTLKELPPITRPSELITELTFNDPNGEVQTASTRIELWPSAVVLGLKTGSWASNRGRVLFQALALDTAGKPIKGQKVEVRGRLAQVISTRKRMVGGFYAYDNRTETKDLGVLCSGSSDDRGLVLCDAALDTAGQVELIAQAKDGNGNLVQAASSVWITKQGELWFAQDNDDRIDVLPEKKSYQPGETAKLQVRMPFREATALVSVEREGILSTQVVTLRGDDPTVELKIDKAWGPNVYVSVLALRGRIREVPWYSFFTWGWKEPMNWVRSFWYEGREYQAPTAMVDLSKPAFKLGVAALEVGIAEHKLQVTVTPDKPQYAIRQKASVRVKVVKDGKPLAGTEVAFAAVDEGLLALKPNDSWDLLHALIQQRAWGVQTATGQSEIIGRRHYGRKAVAAGGGGGKNPTRELFDTLLLWKDRVVLDGNGEAVIEVPINDSLTSFSLVAIADAGVQQFGTGSASIRVTQDLQVLPGLPPLVREGDQFSAMLTLRNTTTREMKVRVALQGMARVGDDIARTPIALTPQEVAIPAGSAKELTWGVAVPPEALSIAWEATADEVGGEKAKDRVKVTQLVSPAVPVRVLQATLQQLDGPVAMPVAAPADALPESGVKRGGLTVAVQPRLTGALPGIRRYFETYPFICLEQKTSKAVGLKDAKLWAAVANALPTYLDSDGLASYFPPRADDGARGSDRLTAYVIAATHEAGFELPSSAQALMLDGLTAFVEGRIERKFWSPRADLDVRKLAAIEALSRHGRAQPKMLGSINLTPNQWPTAAVIDWLQILKRVKGIPDQAKRLEEAQQILRGRLTYAGTTLRFSNEEGDFWWWLMDSADANAARLILAVLDEPGWKDDLPRMVVGSLGRQRHGAWLTTTANLWGSLALDKFAAKFESVKIAGSTVASVEGSKPASIDWARQPEGGAALLAWPEKGGTLNVAQQGSGKPWLTVQSLAAIPLKAPLRAGYSITRSVSAVEQKDKARWSRGDVMRVRLEVEAQSDMTWVVVSDPVPGGATLLGSGLGRDSSIATSGEKQSGAAWPAFEERSFEAFRSYFDYLPKGKHVIEYTVRLNNGGRFSLPPSRVEAMYAPESFGELPNAALEVAP
ncbi:alpha-2-macroglobulin family protein [Piscinibacter gummiphilus]|uniref:MG2 domain-containing protein n=1 Tax=Piscinibacter gummiphilus TaxID=946333 RepID=A0ABZ0CZD6_9BURK|nr:MG2 domain-containing protein [Piscinibacter gummiphilus]WOB08531.1 MG2 domain-containing protein [Piscinibacter gummiphilus]